jgi:hypothetical protein
MRRAGKVMFFSAVLLPIFIIMSVAVDDGGPLIVPVAVFFIALVMMLYARLFSDKTAPVNSTTAQTSALGSTSARGSLPPGTSIPISAVGRQQVKTNELVGPPSVTENTTRLLDNE